jgi:hypothetical protein
MAVFLGIKYKIHARQGREVGDGVVYRNGCRECKAFSKVVYILSKPQVIYDAPLLVLTPFTGLL